jgi:hypothetical protein
MTVLLVALQASAAPTPMEQVMASFTNLRWAAAAILFLLALWFLWGFMQTVRDDPPRIESHWGGFGGGLGGWRMSPSLAYLLGAIAFGVMFIA